MRSSAWRVRSARNSTVSGAVIRQSEGSVCSLTTTPTMRETGLPSTASTALTVTTTGISLWFGGSRTLGVALMLATTGGVSVTVTVKLPVVPFAEQLTVVMPSGKSEPDAGEQVTVAAGSAVATNVTVAPPGPVASTV